MGNRYWITGVQLGMIMAFLMQREGEGIIKKILKEIEEKQFIGSEQMFKKIFLSKTIKGQKW